MNNTRNYDSEFCGKVPLHQTNMVQPHGVLMLVQQKELQIIQVSENVTELLGKPAAEVVATPLTNYITPQQAALLKEKFKHAATEKIPFTFSFVRDGVSNNYLALVQSQPEYLIIEIENEVLNAAENSFISVYGQLKYIISAIESADTIEDVCTTVASELKHISGFDKIMIYQFDEDWNGTVIAEQMEAGMESYLGLKFPASDIPKQAREMYRKNAYRFIPNTDYIPVRLYPVLNPVTHGFTNLIDSNLRSVAAVHLEYLRNMQVMASMSTRIIKDDMLWGLISCHHRTPKYLSYQMCSLFELLSTIISAKVASLHNHQVLQFQSKMLQLHFRIVEQLYKSKDLFGGIYQQQAAVLELLKAKGLALVLNSEIQTIGTTPSIADVEDLVFWLQNNGMHKTEQIINLAGAYENAESYAAQASGVMVLPVQPNKGHYLLAFRPEAVRNVSWGGNPNEAITFEPGGKAYHPRNSFQQWQETVRQTAIPWKKEELEIAENFRNFIVEFTLNNL